MADRSFGNPAGIEKRLAYWANQLSRNFTYPWVGTGLVDDLKCASKMLGAEDFDKLYPFMVVASPVDASSFAEGGSEEASTPEEIEYDL